MLLDIRVERVEYHVGIYTDVPERTRTDLVGEHHWGSHRIKRSSEVDWRHPGVERDIYRPRQPDGPGDEEVCWMVACDNHDMIAGADAAIVQPCAGCVDHELHVGEVKLVTLARDQDGMVGVTP